MLEPTFKCMSNEQALWPSLKSIVVRDQVNNLHDVCLSAKSSDCRTKSLFVVFRTGNQDTSQQYIHNIKIYKLYTLNIYTFTGIFDLWTKPKYCELKIFDIFQFFLKKKHIYTKYMDSFDQISLYLNYVRVNKKGSHHQYMMDQKKQSLRNDIIIITNLLCTFKKKWNVLASF